MKLYINYIHIINYYIHNVIIFNLSEKKERKKRESFSYILIVENSIDHTLEDKSNIYCMTHMRAGTKN